MRTRTSVLTAIAVLAAAAASAQPYHLGMVVGAEFLAGLVQRHLSRSQVAIINVNVGSAMIVDRNASGGPVAFIRGRDSFIWAQIAVQISESTAKSEAMHLEIERWSISAESCPAMATDVGEFLSKLDGVRPTADEGPVSSVLELVVDATTFRIVMAGTDSWVTITPNGALDPPLQRAAGRLHSTVSGCTGSLAPSVERHDF